MAFIIVKCKSYPASSNMHCGHLNHSCSSQNDDKFSKFSILNVFNRNAFVEKPKQVDKFKKIIKEMKRELKVKTKV